MTSNTASFKKQFAAVIKRAGDKADSLVRKVVLDLGNSLIMRSPVDTGRFRSNWQLGVVNVNGDTSSAPGSDAHGRMAMMLQGWTANQTIYITNSLPYAQRLEYGWSKQAPQGMVRLTVADYTKMLREAAS